MTNVHEWSAEDQRRLDLLVDGELRDTEYRELLHRCEGLADGWRRCALAFLEAQQWRREGRVFVDRNAASCAPMLVPEAPAAGFALTQTSATETSTTVAPAVAARQGERPGVAIRAAWWSMSATAGRYALAASVLVAFGLGWGAGQLPHDQTSPTTANFAKVNGSDDLGPMAAATTKTAETVEPTTPAAANIASNTVAADHNLTPEVDLTSGNLVAVADLGRDSETFATNNARREVTLLVDDGSGGPPKRLRVPLRVANTPFQLVANSATPVEASAALPAPDEMLRQMRMLGQQLQQQQLMLPVPMQHGSGGDAPANQLQIQPVLHRNGS